MDCAPQDRLFLLVRAVELIAPGHPIPNPYALMAEARDWASWADRDELKAYALACFDALSADDQSAFLAHVGARGAA